MYHGVDYQEINTGPIQVGEIESAVTVIVGTAPKGPVNSLILVNNPTDAAQFGAQVPGFTIPQALNTHFLEGGQAVMVVNVFDTIGDVTPVEDEVLTLVAGKGKTAFPPVSGLIVKHSSGTPSYVKDTDFSVDDFGNIASLKNATIAAGATLSVSYSKQNASAVSAADLIGTVNGTTGERTGFKCIENAYNLYGKEPKIIIAPGFSELSAVVAEMRYWANKMLAIAIVDAPAGTTVPAAIVGRGPAGAINFNVSDERVVLVYPRILSYDPATDSQVAKPYSQYLSGIIGRVDNDNDSFHFSFSNQPIRTATSLDVTMTSSAINDGTDAEELNKNGIVTVYNEGRSGLRTWGNTSSAYPAKTSIMSFISARRVIDIAIRSMQIACVQYLDLPMTSQLRDAVRATLNSYIRSLAGRGAITDGEAIYDPARNPVDQIAAGRWVFTIRWVPSPPLQRLTLESFVDITLLSKLNEV